MSTAAKTLLLLAIVTFSVSGLRQETTATTSGPQYARNADLMFPRVIANGRI